MAPEPVESPLEAHRVASLPPSFFYIPDFITPDEEAFLLLKINDPKAKWQNLSHRRLQVYPSALTKSNVLLLNPQPSSPSLSSDPLPPWLTQSILPKFQALGIFNTANHGNENAIFPPNHCLINEYPPGQGIMPHEDGAAYAPIVATVSLGSHTVLDLYDKDTAADTDTDPAAAPAADSRTEPMTAAASSGRAPSSHAHRPTRRRSEPAHRILQERRSLLVTVGEAYSALLHGIADVHADRDLAGEQGGGDEDESSSAGVANWELVADKARFVEAAAGAVERGTRVSLTFRRVLKVRDVSKMVFGLGAGGRR